MPGHFASVWDSPTGYPTSRGSAESSVDPALWLTCLFHVVLPPSVPHRCLSKDLLRNLSASGGVSRDPKLRQVAILEIAGCAN